jgi:hypothetical protein
MDKCLNVVVVVVVVVVVCLTTVSRKIYVRAKSFYNKGCEN